MLSVVAFGQSTLPNGCCTTSSRGSSANKNRLTRGAGAMASPWTIADFPPTSPPPLPTYPNNRHPTLRLRVPPPIPLAPALSSSSHAICSLPFHRSICDTPPSLLSLSRIRNSPQVSTPQVRSESATPTQSQPPQQPVQGNTGAAQPEVPATTAPAAIQTNQDYVTVPTPRPSASKGRAGAPPAPAPASTPPTLDESGHATGTGASAESGDTGAGNGSGAMPG